MFGMLDYRANKLFTILFGLPSLLLRWLYTFGAPFLYYGIGKMSAESRIYEVLISILALLIFEIIFSLFFPQISKFFMFLFTLLVDIIPTDGRSKEEALEVVQGGSMILFLLEFNKKAPIDWSEEDIDILSSGFFKFFFKNKIQNRIRTIQQYYIDNPQLTPNEFNTNKFLKSHNLKPSIFEQIFVNPIFRGWVTSATIFVILMILG